MAVSGGKFQRWVGMYGGPEKLALKLGVTSFAVRHWMDRKGYPRVDTIREIVRLSGRTLSFEDIVESTKPKTERGAGSVHVD